MKQNWHGPLDDCARSCIEYDCVNILNKKPFFNFFIRNPLSNYKDITNSLWKPGNIVIWLSIRSLQFVLVEENKYFWKKKRADGSRSLPLSGRVDNRTDTRLGFETIWKINKKPGRISPPFLAAFVPPITAMYGISGMCTQHSLSGQ